MNIKSETLSELIQKSHSTMICDICGDYITADSYQKVLSSYGYINIHDECIETWIQINR